MRPSALTGFRCILSRRNRACGCGGWRKKILFLVKQRRENVRGACIKRTDGFIDCAAIIYIIGDCGGWGLSFSVTEIVAKGL